MKNRCKFDAELDGREGTSKIMKKHHFPKRFRTTFGTKFGKTAKRHYVIRSFWGHTEAPHGHQKIVPGRV